VPTVDLWIIPSAVLYFWAKPPARRGPGGVGDGGAASGRGQRARAGGRARQRNSLATRQRAMSCAVCCVYIPRRGPRAAARSPGTSRARTAAVSSMLQAAAAARRRSIARRGAWMSCQSPGCDIRAGCDIRVQARMYVRQLPAPPAASCRQAAPSALPRTPSWKLWGLQRANRRAKLATPRWDGLGFGI
jgi:hypothetical protein